MLDMRLYLSHLIDMICRVFTNNFVISLLYIITVQRALPPEDVEMEPSNGLLDVIILKAVVRKGGGCDKFTDRQTDDRRSEQLTWAFSSCELKQKNGSWVTSLIWETVPIKNTQVCYACTITFIKGDRPSALIFHEWIKIVLYSFSSSAIEYNLNNKE